MPIRRFLDGQAFDPKTIESMSKALAGACHTLGLKEMNNAAVRLLAMRIIDYAQDGIHDTELLKAAALKGISAVRPRSKFDEYRAKGREAEVQATLANEPEVKRQFDDIARQWFELADRVKPFELAERVNRASD